MSNEKQTKKVGRPKREFSAVIVKKIADAAFLGCQNGTIAGLLNLDQKTMEAHFSKLLREKRCERKQWLREVQQRHAKTNVAMAIFLGKNELGQKDKSEIDHGVTETLASLMLEAAKRNPIQKG